MKQKTLDDLKHKISQRLHFIYKNTDVDPSQLTEKSVKLISSYADRIDQSDQTWNEKDTLLITYGDSITKSNEKGLKTLKRFSQNHFAEAIKNIHILPFFPYSSDDGFSVIDYFQVREDLGDWSDIKELNTDFGLAADLVINHVSSQSVWFQNFLEGKNPGKDFFITEDPEKDLSDVVRPRSSPLLTPFETSEGKKYVWTTFSEDQIDLNFKNPEVFLTMLEALLYYLSNGIRIIRMDAIAFLWKEPGTSCLHLPQTHEIVKLYRDIFDFLGPQYILLTETNVPHKENLSYFGDGDEAHMIYQFSLPPLLLYAFYVEDGHFLNEWGSDLPNPPEGATYLNFTASHDGIGVRPLEGIVPEKQKQELFSAIRNQGGKISTKANSDGTTSPYEMNITYVDALKTTKYSDPKHQTERFISSQLLMAAMKGIPAFYIHSLLGTTNDYEGYEKTGRARSLNRKQWDENEIIQRLGKESQNSEIFNRLTEALRIRKQQPAFHPEAEQKWLKLDDDIIAFSRKGKSQEIISITNVTSRRKRISVQSQLPVKELFSDDKLSVGYSEITIEPFASYWFSGHPEKFHVSTI